MNVLFVVGGGNLNVQISHLALFLEFQKNKINVHLIGNLTEEVINYLKTKAPETSFQKLYPTSKIDKNFEKHFEQLVVDKNITIVHFISGRVIRSCSSTLKKYNTIKVIVYFGSTSLHWYDPSSYLTYLNPRVDAVVCISNFVANHFKKQLFGKNKNKVVTIFKGYKSNWFNEVTPFDYKTLGIPEKAIVVCSVGNHRKVKGTKYFLDSSNYLNSSKEIHYILIGQNTNAPHLKKITDTSVLKNNIHVLGYRNDAASLIAGSDLYVQTSLSEGFGRAICEAMSVSKPIITTNAGGCTELIDKESGIVVPLKDTKAIAGAIHKLATNDTLRVEMGKNAKIRIDTVFSIERAAEETLDLYNSLLK